MADDEEDIVWIREDVPSDPVSPTTPATIIEAAPILSDAFDKPILKASGPPEVTISAPPLTPPVEVKAVDVEVSGVKVSAPEAKPADLPEVSAPAPEVPDVPETKQAESSAPEVPEVKSADVPEVSVPASEVPAAAEVKQAESSVPAVLEAKPSELSEVSMPAPDAPEAKPAESSAPELPAASAPEVTVFHAPEPPRIESVQFEETKKPDPDILSLKLDPKTPNSVDDNSMSFDISECERKFNKAVQEASDMLEDFDKKSKAVVENTKFVAKELAELAASAPRVFQKTIDDHSQVPEVSELPSGGLPKNVESVLIGEGILEEITGTLVLPNGYVLVTDERAGIIAFDLEGNVKTKINPPEFRKLWSPVYHKEHILVLADAKNSEDHWVRHVIKFTCQLEYVAKIECPSWLSECTILRERLSIAHNDHLYLCVCGEIFSGIYELTPIGQWTELEYKLSEAYVDMLAFATIGPITQLLVVEGRRNYVLLVSVRESRIVDKKRMAICERPGALARDEAGRLFVANRFSASIQLVDTMRWVSEKNVAITEAFVRHFTACWGLLAIPLKNAVRLQRYSFRSLR
ncbi:hypothetical protein L5515_005524 [Caenorhabditis briggsae]|uniref:Uncharacterized protein n=2 Tax=Caenorhabditis TaxID=6237 RepID=A0AAE9ES04_CAEBR|nr:hypothetical protein L5515_005524 [Caenorhabditis briggsae]